VFVCLLSLLEGDYIRLILLGIFVIGFVCNFIYYRDKTKTHWLAAGQILILISVITGLVRDFSDKNFLR
jgi:uncharacterized membrane protein